MGIKVGELVQLVPRDGSNNSVGDGIIWRVVKVEQNATRHVVVLLGGQGSTKDIQTLRLIPAWCATGKTRMRPKTMTVGGSGCAKCTKVDAFRLGVLRMELEELCRQALAIEAGVTDEPEKV